MVLAVLLAPGVGAFLDVCVAIVGVLASLVVHEAGHVVVAHRLGFEVTTVQLGLIDSGTTYEGEQRTAPDRVLCALAGPVASVLAAAALGGAAWLLDAHDPLAAPLATFAVLNLVVALLNLVPLPGTDGWEVLHGLRGQAD